MFINIKPTYKQSLAWKDLESPKIKYVVFGGAAGGGKSWCGAEWLLTQCLRYPGSKWFIGRKELKRLMASTYVTFTKVCKFHNVPKEDWKLNGQYNYIEFKNGSRIDLLDLSLNPSDPMFERFGSLEYTGGWIEEAGEVEFLAFDVLKTRIGRHMNDQVNPTMFLTCNPNKGWLYHDVYKPYSHHTLSPEFSFIQSLYNDNPYSADSYREQLESITDKANKERLMFGNWEYDDDPNALIQFDAISDLFTNYVGESRKRYITADIARFGADKSVIYVWEGLRSIKIDVLDGKPVDEVANHISVLMNEYRVPRSFVVVDEDGVGGGVKDILKGVKGFVNNSTPISRPNDKQNYQNLKTQCYYMLADYINNRQISVYCNDTDIRDRLVEDLEQVKTKDSDKEGKLKIIPKDEIKLKLGRSPDYSDALMMRMYFELKPASDKPKVSQYIPKYTNDGIISNNTKVKQYIPTY